MPRPPFQVAAEREFALLKEKRFHFMLADRLHKTVGELMSGITAEEYIEWRALYEVENRERAHERKVQSKTRPRR
jgi:hypothetical protein